MEIIDHSISIFLHSTLLGYLLYVSHYSKHKKDTIKEGLWPNKSLWSRSRNRQQTDKCMHTYIHMQILSGGGRKVKPGKGLWRQFNYRLIGLPNPPGSNFWTKPKCKQWLLKPQETGPQKGNPGRGTSKCKGPEMEMCSWAARRPCVWSPGGNEASGRTEGWIIQGHGEHGKDFGYFSRKDGDHWMARRRKVTWSNVCFLKNRSGCWMEKIRSLSGYNWEGDSKEQLRDGTAIPGKYDRSWPRGVARAGERDWDYDTLYFEARAKQTYCLCIKLCWKILRIYMSNIERVASRTGERWIGKYR